MEILVRSNLRGLFAKGSDGDHYFETMMLVIDEFKRKFKNGPRTIVVCGVPYQPRIIDDDESLRLYYWWSPIKQEWTSIKQGHEDPFDNKSGHEVLVGIFKSIIKRLGSVFHYVQFEDTPLTSSDVLYSAHYLTTVPPDRIDINDAIDSAVREIEVAATRSCSNIVKIECNEEQHELLYQRCQTQRQDGIYWLFASNPIQNPACYGVYPDMDTTVSALLSGVLDDTKIRSSLNEID